MCGLTLQAAQAIQICKDKELQGENEKNKVIKIREEMQRKRMSEK